MGCCKGSALQAAVSIHGLLGTDVWQGWEPSYKEQPWVRQRKGWYLKICLLTLVKAVKLPSLLILYFNPPYIPLGRELDEKMDTHTLSSVCGANVCHYLGAHSSPWLP